MTAVAAVELISRLAPSFAFRDFRLLWVSTLLQSTSMGMIWVVTGWLVFEITDSPFMVGLSSALTMLPFFVLGLVSGAVADRVERRTLLITVTLGGVVVSLIIGAVLITDIAHLWHILALITAGGCVTAFQMTTRQSLTYDIVGPRLALNGMSLNSVSMQVGTVVGSLISGVIISEYGAGGQFIVIGAMYLASVVFLLPVRTRRDDPGCTASICNTQSRRLRRDHAHQPHPRDTDGPRRADRDIRVHSHEPAACDRQGRPGPGTDWFGCDDGRQADRRHRRSACAVFNGQLPPYKGLLMFGIMVRLRQPV